MMNLKPGITGTLTEIVEKKDTALAVGSGLAEVYATPAMITLMEKTAYQSIQEHLDERYSSVGIEINVKHKRASLPGAIISCTSTLISIDNKKIHFNISASDESGEIGSASHTRYIVDQEEFMNRLKNN